jgi:hypothetical protein
MMRKVNETRMRVDQLLRKKSRQLDKFQDLKPLTDQIARGKEAIVKLRDQILKSEAQIKNTLDEIEHAKLAKIREIEATTNEVETAHRAKLAQIQHESDQALHKLQSEQTEIEQNITQIMLEKAARLNALQSSADSRRAELVRSHTTKVEELTEQRDALNNTKADLEASNSAAVTQFFSDASKAIETAFKMSISYPQTAPPGPVRSSSKAGRLREKREELLALNGDVRQKFLALIELLEAGRVPERPRTPLPPISQDD